MKKNFKIAAMTVGALLITSGNAWAATVYDKVELQDRDVLHRQL